MIGNFPSKQTLNRFSFFTLLTLGLSIKIFPKTYKSWMKILSCAMLPKSQSQDMADWCCPEPGTQLHKSHKHAHTQIKSFLLRCSFRSYIVFHQTHPPSTIFTIHQLVVNTQKKRLKRSFYLFSFSFFFSISIFFYFSLDCIKLYKKYLFRTLKLLHKYKQENERLRAENRALTRVVSKLTTSAQNQLLNKQ